MFIDRISTGKAFNLVLPHFYTDISDRAANGLPVRT